ncbi:unnamed protein product [Caenorhabditis bovis]|uniref:Large ribosomal subunit protein uL24m n=1 Tax=Caenorhabditis bovis TaxID=2654633 RepID=A0A8S1F9F1_9PELO|nr:unnamed protein product [Caenorhabditis bovis]
MIRGINPIYQALLAASFTWGVTALGASLVFVMRHQSKKLLDVSLGFAAGVMTAASFWSLLSPAIEIAETDHGSFAFVPVAIGFAVGAIFVHFADTLLPTCISGDVAVVDLMAPPAPRSDTEMTLMPDREDLDVAALARSVNEDRAKDAENIGESRPDVIPTDADYRQSWRRIILLILAVTVHNIPEGLAVGVGFGSAGKTASATFESAFNLAIGIGLQNFPEGLAVSLPLAAFGHSKLKAFWYGQLSGMVEPIAALFGAAAVIFMEPILPYALAFAAGAMIYVVVDDIIPEAQRNGNGKLASIGCIVGFLVMMCMDMLTSRILRFPRKPFVDFDYARHMPDAYVERMKRTVPRKVYGNRFGAPDLKQMYLHPDDYVPGFRRPWEDRELSKNIERSDKYFGTQLSGKFFKKRFAPSKRMKDIDWTFFPGDLVQVMVGKDKGRQGIVMQVSRDTSEVLVDGLHTKLGEDMEGSEKLGVDKTLRWQEQPLSVEKGHVMLVDPNDEQPCSARWQLNAQGDEYIRISNRSGFEIPIPSQAKVTYEYLQPENYIEVEGKDTTADEVLERTYVPKVMSFEQEIMNEMGIEENRKPAPTYWY